MSDSSFLKPATISESPSESRSSRFVLWAYTLKILWSSGYFDYEIILKCAPFPKLWVFHLLWEGESGGGDVNQMLKSQQKKNLFKSKLIQNLALRKSAQNLFLMNNFQKENLQTSKFIMIWNLNTERGKSFKVSQIS